MAEYNFIIALGTEAMKTLDARELLEWLRLKAPEDFVYKGGGKRDMVQGKIVDRRIG